jgi:hypothetical protein
MKDEANKMSGLHVDDGCACRTHGISAAAAGTHAKRRQIAVPTTAPIP